MASKARGSRHRWLRVEYVIIESGRKIEGSMLSKVFAINLKILSKEYMQFFSKSIIANHRLVFDLLLGAEQDQHSYILCWLDLVKNVPTISE